MSLLVIIFTFNFFVFITYEYYQLWNEYKIMYMRKFQKNSETNWGNNLITVIRKLFIYENRRMLIQKQINNDFINQN